MIRWVRRRRVMKDWVLSGAKNKRRAEESNKGDFERERFARCPKYQELMNE